MAVADFPILTSDLEPIDLAKAATLQNLLDKCVELLRRYQIDHAIVYSVPNETQSMVLPLLPVEPELKLLIDRAVRQGHHPALALCTSKTDNAIEEFSKLVDPSATVIEQMKTRWNNAGIKQAYELPLTNGLEVQTATNCFVLELGRIGQRISIDELTDIQKQTGELPTKLSTLTGVLEYKSTSAKLDYQIA